MGFNLIDLNKILYTLKMLKIDIENFTFLELGEQELKVKFDENIPTNLIKFIESKPRNYKKNNTRYSFYAKDYLNSIFKFADSLDFITKCPKTYKLDLGKALNTQNFNKTYNVINNNGTTEHVGEFKGNFQTETYNPQYEAFKNIHNLTKKGGYVFNSVPHYDEFRHGAYGYNVKFFIDLAEFNNYQIIYLYTDYRGELYHTYCCFKKIGNNKFIDINKFNQIRGLKKRRKKYKE